MLVDLRELPPEIYQRIPLSIRTRSSVYELDQLPAEIQALISNHIHQQQKEDVITYKQVFDFKPHLSEKADFTPIDEISALIKEYLKNYLLTSQYDYPFDPVFGSHLKQNLQTRDTATRKLLIDQEVQNITNVIANDLQVPIKLENVTISNTSNGIASYYNIVISLRINEQAHTVNVTV